LLRTDDVGGPEKCSEWGQAPHLPYGIDYDDKKKITMIRFSDSPVKLVLWLDQGTEE